MREINDVLWIVPLQRTEKFLCSDSIRILRRCVEIPGNSLSPRHYSTFYLARTREGLLCFKDGEYWKAEGKIPSSRGSWRVLHWQGDNEGGGDGRIQGSV